MDLKDHIRGIPDFPKPGILFYDISTLLRDADAWQVAMGRMARAVRAYQPDLLAGVESRGFLIAAPLALKLGCGFIMLRKRGKLPGRDSRAGLRAGIRHRPHRDAGRRGGARAAGGGGGRSARDRRHDGGRHRAAAEVRRGRPRGGRADRTRLPQRAEPAGRAVRGAGLLRIREPAVGALSRFQARAVAASRKRAPRRWDQQRSAAPIAWCMSRYR